MKKITDKDVEALKAGKKVTKGFIHMQLDDKGIQLRGLHGKRIYIHQKDTRIGGRIYVILYLEVL